MPSVNCTYTLQAKENSLVMMEEAVNPLEISLRVPRRNCDYYYYSSNRPARVFYLFNNVKRPVVSITCFRTKSFFSFYRRREKYIASLGPRRMYNPYFNVREKFIGKSNSTTLSDSAIYLSRIFSELTITRRLEKNIWRGRNKTIVSKIGHEAY